MKRKTEKNQSTLAQIEDFYAQKGLRGSKLRGALKRDSQYQRLLVERRKKIKKKFRIKPKDLQKYVLSTYQDYEILEKVYRLENKSLKTQDKNLIRFIRTQLELDWRKQIIKELDDLAKKYAKRNIPRKA